MAHEGAVVAIYPCFTDEETEALFMQMAVNPSSGVRIWNSQSLSIIDES